MRHAVGFVVAGLLGPLEEGSEPLLEDLAVGRLGEVGQKGLRDILRQAEGGEYWALEVVEKLVPSQEVQGLEQRRNLTDDLDGEVDQARV